MVTFVPTYVSEALRAWSESRDAERRRLQEVSPERPEEVEAALERWQREHPRPACTLAQVADHVDHVRAVAGIDHVGIGSDFDGIGQTPAGLEDVSHYPDLIAELLRRGYSDAQVKQVMGLNVIRVMRQVEEASVRIRAERPPSEAQIDELDGRAHGSGG
jgi:membrane dipeptidase